MRVYQGFYGITTVLLGFPRFRLSKLSFCVNFHSNLLFTIIITTIIKTIKIIIVMIIIKKAIVIKERQGTTEINRTTVLWNFLILTNNSLSLPEVDLKWETQTCLLLSHPWSHFNSLISFILISLSYLFISNPFWFYLHLYV